ARICGSMPGRWRATGCGIPRYRWHRVLRRVFVHAVHTHRETVAQIAEVLPQRRLCGFAGLEAVRFPRGLAHRPPALNASPVVCDDLNDVNHSHTVSCAEPSSAPGLHRFTRVIPPFFRPVAYNKMSPLTNVFNPECGRIIVDCSDEALFAHVQQG